jgi:hypothetical protein
MALRIANGNLDRREFTGALKFLFTSQPDGIQIRRCHHSRFAAIRASLDSRSKVRSVIGGPLLERSCRCSCDLFECRRNERR